MMKTNLKTILVTALLAIGPWANAQQVSPPVKGVGTVVKRNPGSGASKVAPKSNEKGETTIQIAERGNYVITVLQPTPTGAAMTETHGGPVKGVKVALGKNPSGLLVRNQLVNDKGEVEFKDLTPGSYTIKTVSASNDCPPGFVLKNGVCEPIVIIDSQSRTIRTSCEGGTMDCREKVVDKDGITWWIYADNSDCPQRGQSCTGSWSVDKEKLINFNPDNGINSSGSTNYIGHVTLLRFSEIYFGGGLQMPSTKTKTSGLVNGIDLNLGYYHPIWAWDKSNISLGINGELGYTMGNGDYDLDGQYTVYQLVGQVKEPLVAQNTQSSKSSSFRAGAGLQMNIHLGKLTLSPILNAGYLSTNLKSFTVDETIYPQGSSITYRLLEQKSSKTSGLGVLPKLRLTYSLSPKVGIWLEGNYIMGPKISTESTRFELDPTIPSDSYNEGNFAEGKYITTKNETSYSAVGLNLGVVLRLDMKSNGTVTSGTSTNFISNPCYETIKTLYCYDGNNNCKLICDNVNNSFCGMQISKKEIPCNTSTPTGTVNSMIKSYTFKEKAGSADELSYQKIREIINQILPNFNVEDVTLNSYQNNYLLLVEGSQNKVSANINIMLANENGKLYTSDDIRILQCSNPNAISKSTDGGRKHDYVGHVTLLR